MSTSQDNTGIKPRTHIVTALKISFRKQKQFCFGFHHNVARVRPHTKLFFLNLVYFIACMFIFENDVLFCKTDLVICQVILKNESSK
jgi:hypothetical protein